jgi:hypothetical protein
MRLDLMLIFLQNSYERAHSIGISKELVGFDPLSKGFQRKKKIP